MQSVFLVGLMGAGKTTVGRRLSRRLGWMFYDSDREIEARCGVPVATIFDLEGEDGFRRRESQVIAELARRPGIVMATGGGAVLRQENRQALNQGFVIYLRASVEDLWRRTRHDRSRPLLQTADPRARLQALMTEREPLYLQVADATVDTGQQPVSHVVRRVWQVLSDHRVVSAPFDDGHPDSAQGACAEDDPSP